MKKGIFIIVVLISLISFSQEKENYKLIITEFTGYFNAKDSNAIFNMFDNAMQNAIPLDKTEGIVNQLQDTFGSIEKVTFSKIESQAHIYNTKLEKGQLDIILHLNDANKIDGLRFVPSKTDSSGNNNSTLQRNTTKMIWPFKEEAFVFWGGTTEKQNYHVASKDQKYAYDILMVKDGASYNGKPLMNKNYFIFGKDIIAPCDAKVATVITGIYDNKPGEMNRIQLTGNTIVLETEAKEYLLFAHLKKGSIKVKEGDVVKQGDVIAQCGNSGNSSEPHLHLSLQNQQHMSNATGAKLYFDNIIVNGELKTDYLPVKEDFVKNNK